MKSSLLLTAASFGIAMSAPTFHAAAADPTKSESGGFLNVLKQKMTPKDLTADETERMLKLQSDIVIIDVRTSEEFAQGHLQGAVNLDFFAPNFAEKMKGYEGKPVLIHCASGGRSGQTVNMIKDGKFSAIYHLKSGFTGWQAAGKPVVR
jgi:rhodanese-related sulfurtransferase